MSLLQSEIKILHAIRENKTFRLAFGNVAPQIVDKIYSYASNPNCSCKAPILKWVTENEDKINTLTSQYEEYFSGINVKDPIQNKDFLPSIPDSAGKPVVPHASTRPIVKTVPKMGHVEIIDGTPTAYTELFKKINLERWMFRGINIIEKKIDDKDVWLIMFY
jgi:hypothetical protein